MNDVPSWAVVSTARREHVGRVVELLASWAEHMGKPAAERGRWIRAGYLHDALRDADSARVAQLAGTDWTVPSVRHGPAAATLAAEHGEADPGVLNAVRYHSVGFADWDAVGRMLYLADYLEPGRTFSGDARLGLSERVPHDPDAVLREVAMDRIAWGLRSGWSLHAETVRFWNALVH